MPPDTHSAESVSREIEMGATVKIVVNDPEGVIGRYVKGGAEHPYGHPYGLTTETQIYEHLAYNALANGVEHANVLDGWADLADDAATMHVSGVEPLA
jgi:hypothetical protein